MVKQGLNKAFPLHLHAINIPLKFRYSAIKIIAYWLVREKGKEGWHYFAKATKGTAPLPTPSAIAFGDGGSLGAGIFLKCVPARLRSSNYVPLH